MVRLVRGQVLRLREEEFVQAARVAGASHFRIIVRHLMPNVLGTMIIAPFSLSPSYSMFMARRWSATGLPL